MSSLGAVLLLAACASVRPEPAASLVLRGRLIDGTGAPAVENAVVVVDGERIRCVGGPGVCRVPRGTRVIDVGEGTILPGLIDLHTHARPHYLWMFLAAGVTSFRDLNNEFPLLESMGKDGPDRARIFWSGPLVDGEKSVIRQMGGRIFAAATPEAARAAVDSLVAAGVDVIKLYEQLPPDAFAAAAARARELGMPVAADLGTQLTRGLMASEVDALQALAAGVSSIEHLSGFALAYRRLGGDPAAETLDPVLIDSLARAVVRHDAAVVPTLIVNAGFAAESLAFAAGIPLADRLPEGMGEWWTQSHGSLSPAARARAAADLRLSTSLLRRIHALGGRIGAGSDTPAGPYDIPGGGLHYELQLLVEQAGLSPLAAIHAATGEAARILGRPELGVLAAGKVADLIVVDGDPARVIGDTRKLRLVMKDGRLWKAEELLDREARAQAPLVEPAAEAARIEIPRGAAPTLDGILSAGEWDDAALVTINVEPGWEVPVRIKQDGAHLYVAFAGLKRGDAERYPEILLDLSGARGAGTDSAGWGDGHWWFHASYQDCEGRGVFNNYQCSPTKPGWEANNFPLAAPGTVEFRISYEKLGLDPARIAEIGIAFNVTDTQSAWSFWPGSAAMERPASWASARLLGGGRASQ